MTYSQIGKYEKALEHLQKALIIRREVHDKIGETSTLNNLGYTHQLLGQADQALIHYQQALEIAQQLGFRRGAGAILNNVGFAHSSLAHYEQAHEVFQQALTLAQEIGEQSLEATTLSNEGKLLAIMKKYELSHEYYQRGLQITEKVGYQRLSGKLLNHIGETYARQEQYAQALDVYNRALAIQQEVGDPADIIVVLANIGAVYKKLGVVLQAIEFYQKAVDVYESLLDAVKVDDLKVSFAGESSEVYEQLVHLLWDAGRFEDAFNYIERSRAQAFLSQLANRRINLRAGLSSDLLAREQDLRATIVGLRKQMSALRSRPHDQWDSAVMARTHTELDTREKEYARLLVELKLQNPEVAALVSVEASSLADVQRLLDTQITLIAYFVAEQRTLAFVITSDAVQTIALSVSRERLTAAISTFRDFANLDIPASEMQQLYTWLIEPLAPYLTTYTVGIIPHGILHYIPFAALMSNQQYLSERYALYTLPSLSTLRYIMQKRKNGTANLLAMAPNHVAGLPTLHYAAREAQTIAGLYGAQALIGRAATKAALRARVDGITILHLAAHGQLNTANPLFSRIMLTPDDKDDGALEVYEIYELNLEKANVVVLSACQTLLGAHSRGDDIVGLNRAFIYAGTPSVIASLWSVDDEATYLVMASFYQNLQRGMSKADALRTAQAALRKQPKFAHPYYWAAFVLMGDPGLASIQTSP